MGLNYIKKTINHWWFSEWFSAFLKICFLHCTNVVGAVLQLDGINDIEVITLASLQKLSYLCEEDCHQWHRRRGLICKRIKHDLFVNFFITNISFFDFFFFTNRSSLQITLVPTLLYKWLSFYEETRGSVNAIDTFRHDEQWY